MAETKSTDRRALVIYVDVDDTLVRSAGSKRIPIPAAIEHIKRLKHEGAVLYCWSSGGADYAKTTATELGLSDCFADFLPKPDVMIDDQNPSTWKYLICVHPSECSTGGLDAYAKRLRGP